MAGSLAVLISYIENLMWLCTRFVYGLIFIFELNYKLVAGFFTGCVQLWNFAIHAVLVTGNGIVTTIQFLSQLPLKTYIFAEYLIGVGSHLSCEAFRVGVSCAGMLMTFAFKCFIDAIQTLQSSFVSLSNFLVDAATSGVMHAANSVKACYNDIAQYFMDLRSETGVALFNAKVSIGETMVSFGHSLAETATSILNYPVSVWNWVSCCVTDFYNTLLEQYTEIACLTKDFVEQVCASVANTYYDWVIMLHYVASFPQNKFYQCIDSISMVSAEVAKTWSSVTGFVFENWYAIIALSLCLSLLALVTIYLHVQYFRNAQTAMQDLTRLFTSLTRSLARHQNQADAHQDNLPLQQPQMLEFERDQIPLEINNHHERRQVNEGGDGLAGTSGTRRRTQRKYSLRSQASDQNSNSKETGTGDELRHLKHQLDEEIDKKLCVVCQDFDKDTLLLPCRHLCVCLRCADAILDHAEPMQRRCPLCRERIRSILEVYH